MKKKQKILALDFDGVICDGLLEYFQITVRTYQQIWQDPTTIDFASLAERFYRLRPVIETGWEMPILLRSIVLNIAETEIFANWGEIATSLLHSINLDKQFLSQKLDGLRDEWIANNLEEWLDLHQLYPNLGDKLQQIIGSNTDFYIITTKEGRFVQKILQKYAIKLSEINIFGKEVKVPKYESLRRIIANYDPDLIEIDFIEDRFKTLLSIEGQTDLNFVNLYLADWGYNTSIEREKAAKHGRIELLSLPQFLQKY
jgi:phosphoglycolate phosphatase-like HAD superfamily hydrolase